MTNESLLRLIGHASELADCLEQFDNINQCFWEDYGKTEPERCTLKEVAEAYTNASTRFGMLTTEYGKLARLMGQRANEYARAVAASDHKDNE